MTDMMTFSMKQMVRKIFKNGWQIDSRYDLGFYSIQFDNDSGPSNNPTQN